MAKTRYEMAKQLEKLPELHKRTQDISTASLDEYVSLSLLTKEELSEYLEANGIQYQIQDAMDKAKKALPDPDMEGKLPAEFVKLEQRKRELDIRYKFIDSVRSVLYDLAMRGSFSSGASRAIWLPQIAEKVRNQFQAFDDPDSTERNELTDSIDRKTRTNSVVTRIRQEVWGQHRQQENEAAEQVRMQAERKHKDILDRKKYLETLIARRRQELLEPIKQEIKELLESVIDG